MDDQIRRWKDSTWQISPALNARELDPAAVQFAVLESDPIEDYRKLLIKSGVQFRKEIEEERDVSKRELHKRVQMSVTWDGLFRAARGDQVYLLAPSKSKANESRVRKTIVSSSSPQGRRWLTTKVTNLGDRPVCWCIPVDATIGKSIEVELRKENLFDLQKEYHELVEVG